MLASESARLRRPPRSQLAPPRPPAPAPRRYVVVETYSDIASRFYAERDADAFKSHVRALGVPERNIVLLKGAKAGKASLEKNLEAWLPRMAKADSRVYFYFSGHGRAPLCPGTATRTSSRLRPIPSPNSTRGSASSR
jgi:hypothetical protein